MITRRGLIAFLVVIVFGLIGMFLDGNNNSYASMSAVLAIAAATQFIISSIEESKNPKR